MLNLVILSALVGASLWAVMTRSLLRSAIGLALASILLTIVMFNLNSPLAAVFELSVCAGLISVLFISTISLSYPMSGQEKAQEKKEKLARFWFLPVILAVLAFILISMNLKFGVRLPATETTKDVRVVMWQLRQLDIIGQIIILLAGVFGVIIFFKEQNKK